MKNKLKSMFNKAFLSTAAVLGLGAGVAQAQQVVCAPISAQQIFNRQYSQEINNCASISFNYSAQQTCMNNASYNYNMKMSQHPNPYAPTYCDPLYTQPPAAFYAPPVYVQQPVDPVAAIIGTIILGGVIYNHNKHHHDYRPHVPQHHRYVAPPPSPHHPHDNNNNDGGRRNDGRRYDNGHRR